MVKCAGQSASQEDVMKRYRAHQFNVLYNSYEACNDPINHDAGTRIGGLRADTKFIVLKSIGRSHNVVSGEQVGWIWAAADSLASMEVKES